MDIPQNLSSFSLSHQSLPEASWTPILSVLQTHCVTELLHVFPRIFICDVTLVSIGASNGPTDERRFFTEVKRGTRNIKSTTNTRNVRHFTLSILLSSNAPLRSKSNIFFTSHGRLPVLFKTSLVVWRNENGAICGNVV